MPKLYYDARDIIRLLDLGSSTTAHRRIQELNKELESMGYKAEPGRVPVKFFEDRYPYAPKLEES